MNVIYQLFSRLSPLIYTIGGWINPKIARINVGRKETFTKIKDYANKLTGIEKTYWIHAASLGEYDQMIPVIELIKSTVGNNVIVSFFSPSGYDNCKADLIDLKFFLPADQCSHFEHIFSVFKPEKIIFSKYDLWPNFVATAYRHNIPMLVAGMDINENSSLIKKPNSLHNLPYGSMQFLLTNTDKGAELLRQSGFERAYFTGSPKIERAAALPALPHSPAGLEDFIKGGKIIIIGSAWSREIKLVQSWWKPDSGFKLVIAPHEPTLEMVNLIRHTFKGETELFSELSTHSSTKDILIIDTMGDLSKIYRYATIAFIGGGFDDGIHNILEPAAYGIPVLSGPNYIQFSEAVQLKESGAYFPINDEIEFTALIQHLSTDADKLQHIRLSLAEYFRSNVGAAAKITQYIYE